MTTASSGALAATLPALSSARATAASSTGTPAPCSESRTPASSTNAATVAKVTPAARSSCARAALWEARITGGSVIRSSRHTQHGAQSTTPGLVES